MFVRYLSMFHNNRRRNLELVRHQDTYPQINHGCENFRESSVVITGSYHQLYWMLLAKWHRYVMISFFKILCRKKIVQYASFQCHANQEYAEWSKYTCHVVGRCFALDVLFYQKRKWIRGI